MSGEPDDNEISLESLQAQIDMSMSFAQNLVSSWVKPQKKTGTSQRKELEQQLLEAASRRPRLGVGASVSDSNTSLPRETARLKGQLVGKKRSREQEELDAKKMDVDDEEESREGAIKKKAKFDPFDKPTKKKASALALPPPPSIPKTKEVVESVVEPPSEKISTPSDPSTPKKKKKKKNKNSASIPTAPSDTPCDPLPVSSAPVLASTKETTSMDTLDILSTTSSSGSTDALPVPSKSPTKPPSHLLKGLSVPSTSKLPAELANKPVLNLQEISDDSDTDDAAPQSAVSSSKKKRRRRKKKKGLGSTPASPVPAEQSSMVKILIS